MGVRFGQVRRVVSAGLLIGCLITLASPALVSRAGAVPLARVPATSPTPTRSPLVPSSVTASVQTDGSSGPDAIVTLIADLAPQAAWGDVTLYDGGVKVASDKDYRIRWSYTTDHLSVGTHHFRFDFDPDSTSGYAPSQARLDYVVTAPVVASATPTPTPTPSVTRSKDPQPIVVTFPSVSVKATSTARSTSIDTPRPSPSVSVEATSASRSRGGGALPFTGMNAAGAITAGVVLIGSGSALVLAARRRRRRA